jgi:Zn-dependent M16 (insulinase) family peptidase
MKIKRSFPVCLALITLVASCGKPKEETKNTDPSKDSANMALYEEVMKIHDEVMPKMEDIMKMKQALKEEIKNTPDMVEARRKEIDSILSRLDVASKSMMNWMHEFSPPDSATNEEYKKFLEDQLEKVKVVKENILGVVKD